MSEFLKKKKELKYKFINSLDFSQSDINEEVIFIDDSYIEKKFRRFKREYNEINEEINKIKDYSAKDEYSLKRIKDLLLKQNNLVIKSMFIITNNEKYLEQALRILEVIKQEVNYKKALNAIVKYNKGDIYGSSIMFKEYYAKINRLPNHYLINKTYAEIMLINKEYKIAVELIRKAIEVKPDDMELHIKIKKLYEDLGMKKEAFIEDKIINLLGGNKKCSKPRHSLIKTEEYHQ